MISLIKQLKIYSLSGLILFSSSLISTSPSVALSCQFVEKYGNGQGNREILEAIQKKHGGYIERINKRRRIVVNYVKSVSFSGCTAYATFDVTYQRPRRDAKGDIRVSATVESFDPISRQVCYGPARVIHVRLSRTPKFVEQIIRRRAPELSGGCTDPKR